MAKKKGFLLRINFLLWFRTQIIVRIQIWPAMENVYFYNLTFFVQFVDISGSQR